MREVVAQLSLEREGELDVAQAGLGLRLTDAKASAVEVESRTGRARQLGDPRAREAERREQRPPTVLLMRRQRPRSHSPATSSRSTEAVTCSVSSRSSSTGACGAGGSHVPRATWPVIRSSSTRARSAFQPSWFVPKSIRHRRPYARKRARNVTVRPSFQGCVSIEPVACRGMTRATLRSPRRSNRGRQRKKRHARGARSRTPPRSPRRSPFEPPAPERLVDARELEAENAPAAIAEPNRSELDRVISDPLLARTDHPGDRSGVEVCWDRRRLREQLGHPTRGRLDVIDVERPAPARLRSHWHLTYKEARAPRLAPSAAAARNRRDAAYDPQRAHRRTSRAESRPQPRDRSPVDP